MTSYEYLKYEISEKLGGDGQRVAELFNDESIFDALIALGQNSDWYHYQRKTFDGWYLVRGPVGFEAYYQERGTVSQRKTFEELIDAAAYFFSASGFLRS